MANIKLVSTATAKPTHFGKSGERPYNLDIVLFSEISISDRPLSIRETKP